MAELAPAGPPRTVRAPSSAHRERSHRVDLAATVLAALSGHAAAGSLAGGAFVLLVAWDRVILLRDPAERSA